MMWPPCIALALLGLLVDCLAHEALAKTQPRAGRQPCRVAAQALIHYLDKEQHAGSEYAHAYRMVETCGPVRTAKMKAKPVRAVSEIKTCRALALKMLDELDENRMTRPTFVSAREQFAVACAPAPGIEPKAPATN